MPISLDDKSSVKDKESTRTNTTVKDDMVVAKPSSKENFYKLITRIKENDSRSLLTSLSLKDLDFRFIDRKNKSELVVNNYMTQAQSYYFLTNEGELIFMQLGYANFGLKPLCQISARYFKPGLDLGGSEGGGGGGIDPPHNDEETQQRTNTNYNSESNLPLEKASSSIFNFFKNTQSLNKLESLHHSGTVNKFATENISASEWRKESDGVSSKVGLIFSSSLSSGGEALHLSFHKSKALMVDLSITQGSDIVQFKDGVVKFEKANNDPIGFMHFRFAPKLNFKGTIALDFDGKGCITEKKVEGTGALCHIAQGLKPHLAASYWVFCLFQSAPIHSNTATASTNNNDMTTAEDQVTILMSHLGTPETYNDIVFNQGTLVINGEIIGLSINNKVSMENFYTDSFSGYRIPRLVVYEWEGTTTSGKPWKARISQIPTIWVDKIDLLAEIPFMFRKFIQAFYTKPFCFEWLDDTILELSIDEKPTKQIHGKLFHELSLLN